jgi:hypothetical protein
MESEIAVIVGREGRVFLGDRILHRGIGLGHGAFTGGKKWALSGAAEDERDSFCKKQVKFNIENSEDGMKRTDPS